MAVDFLSDEQAAGFGRFPDEVSREDLERFCWLDDADLSVAGRRRGMHNRLGFAVQLATVRVVGRFLTDPLAAPWPVVESLAGQLGIADASVLKLYAQRGQTGYEHAAEISAVYGYVDFADPVKYEELRLFLSARAWTSSEGPVRLFERAAVWLRERKVLLPGVSTLTRLVAEVRAGANDRLYAVLVDAAAPALIQELEALLRVEDGSRLTAWETLRTGPSRVSVPELLRQLDRLTRLRALGAGTIDVETVPAGRMNALARYGLAGKASALQGLSGQRRGATLLCAVRALTSEVADDLCDALDAIVAERVVRKAARESTAARLKSLPRLSRASMQLAKAAKTLVEVLGNTEYSGAEAASVLAEQVSLPELRAAVDVVTELVNPDGNEGDTAAEMMRRFTTVRSFLPALASAEPFGATAGGAPTLTALAALPDVLASRIRDPSQVDLSVLSPAWQGLIEGAGEIDRRAYTVAVMDAVHKALRRRDIFVVGGRRWGDPRARLLTDPAWQATKNETLTSLQLPEEPAAHLEGVRHSLDARYRAAADQLADNPAVRIDDDGKVHLSPLEAKTIPESLTQLRGQCPALGRRPVVDSHLTSVGAGPRDVPACLSFVPAVNSFVTDKPLFVGPNCSLPVFGERPAAVVVAGCVTHPPHEVIQSGPIVHRSGSPATAGSASQDGHPPAPRPPPGHPNRPKAAIASTRQTAPPAPRKHANLTPLTPLLNRINTLIQQGIDGYPSRAMSLGRNAPSAEPTSRSRQVGHLSPLQHPPSGLA